MLDKSLPYHNIIMLRKARTPIPTSPLPQGFSFGTGSTVAAEVWGELMVSVGEFDTLTEALTYYQEEYGAARPLLEDRMLTVLAPDGRVVGTTTLWWRDTDGRKDPTLEWVAVLPEYQGIGLGKALVFEAMHRMRALEGDRDFWLHTQTWSHRAIPIYLKAGYRMQEYGAFGGYANDYAAAREVLEPLLGLLLRRTQEA